MPWFNGGRGYRYEESGNFISISEYDKLRVSVGGGLYDWTVAIQKALNDAKTLGSTVLFPRGTYDIYGTIYIPETVKISGLSNNSDGSIINYKGSAQWAFKTSGLHQRNYISNIRLELNGNGNGILLGDYKANLPDNQVPIHFSLDDIVVSGIGASYVGIMTINASHYTMNSVHIGFGITSGKGLSIFADYYNSGVASFTNCTLGRVDYNSVGLQMDATVNMDGFFFSGCYFGGKTPIKIGSANTFLRNINLNGHAEGRNVGNTVNIVELHNVLGGNIDGFTFAGFGVENTNAVSFKGTVQRFNIKGTEANGIMGTMFLDNGATLIEDCILQNPIATNGSTTTVFSSGFSDKNFKFDFRKFVTENIRTKFLFSVDGTNREYWASAPDSTQGHTRGDIVKNTNPSRTRNISHWKCSVTGTSGVFQAYGTGWGTTAERPSLLTNDAGYTYFDTTISKMILWNGSAWLV